MSQNEPFDRAALIAEFGLIPRIDRRRKLSLEGQCTVYACLHEGIHYSIVAEAFGVTRATVSAIGGCRDDERKPVIMEVGGHTETLSTHSLAARRNPDRRRRYQEVAQEFERLGEDEFFRRYFTNDIVERMKIALKQLKNTPAFDSKYTSHARVYPDGEGYIRVYLIPDHGWTYAGCTVDGKKLHENFVPNRDDNGNWFRTSKAAHDHFLKNSD